MDFAALPTRYTVRFFDRKDRELASLTEDGQNFRREYSGTSDEARTMAVARLFSRLFIVNTNDVLDVSTVVFVTATDSVTCMETTFWITAGKGGVAQLCERVRFVGEVPANV